jgi:uncharacterized delta-60 repeat protein
MQHYDVSPNNNSRSRALIIFSKKLFFAAIVQFIWVPIAISQPGTLDLRFGTSGLARALIPSTNLNVKAAALQSDGKIVAVGSCTASTGLVSFCISRLNADGTTNVFGNITWHHSNQANTYAIPHAVAVDASDRIVVSGTCLSAVTGADYCVARFLRDGILDTTFGNGGFVITAIEANTASDNATSMRLQADGKILVGGSCARGGATVIAMCLVRYQSNGTLDTTFGVQGVAALSFVANPSNRTDLLYALEIDEQGQIYAAGGCQWSSSVATKHFCVITATSFGYRIDSTAIQASASLSNDSFIRAVAWTADRALAVAGTCNSGATTTGVDFCIARFRPGQQWETLNLDAGSAGVLRTAIGFQALDDAIRAMVVQPDGRFVVGGTCGLNQSTSGDAFCWMRHMPTGEADRSIAANTDGVGVVVTEFVANSARHDRAGSVLRTADGNILLVGACQGLANTQYDVCAAKYLSGPAPSLFCSPDIDGDGRVNPLIDGLIMTRVALGQRTSAIMQGIVPPTNAVRRGWHSGGIPGIAEYLERNCGVSGLVYTKLITSH